MWNFIFTEYFFGTAITFFLMALGFILPSVIFAHKIVGEKASLLEMENEIKKSRITKRAKIYQDKFRQL